jgi:hypothetical protein
VSPSRVSLNLSAAARVSVAILALMLSP